MTRYEQGFLKKCAEHGVDGRVLLKKAQEAAAQQPEQPQQPQTPETPSTLERAKGFAKDQYNAALDWGKANQSTVGGALGGGAVGATALLLHELMRQRKDKDDRKHYLRKALAGLVLGGAAGGLGAHYGQQAYDWAKPKAQAAVTRARTAVNATAGK